MKAEYLGDGLYVEFDGYQLRVFASDGMRVTNEVFLEPSVVHAFEDYLVRVRATLLKSQQKDEVAQ